MARTPAPGTRARILSVAAHLFYEYGVRGVGLNQVIAEAGTGKKLLYTHFPTKTDLIAAYLTRVAEIRAEDTRRGRERAPDDPHDQLVAIVEEVAHTVRGPEFRGCAFRNYLAEFPEDTDVRAPAHPTPARVAHAYLESTRSDIARQVARLRLSGQHADRLAEQLWLLIDGLYMQAAYRDRTCPGLERSATAAVDLARALVQPLRRPDVG